MFLPKKTRTLMPFRVGFLTILSSLLHYLSLMLYRLVCCLATHYLFSFSLSLCPPVSLCFSVSSVCHYVCLCVLSSSFLSVYLSLSSSSSFTIPLSHLESPISSSVFRAFNLGIFLNLNDFEPSDSL